jgi:hypothetical protein
MKYAKLVGSLVVASGMLLLAPAPPASALSCVGRDSVEVEFAESDAVFSGRIVDSSVDGSLLRFRVSQAWKGIDSRYVSVIHTDAGWGGDLPEGEYYVFAIAGSSHQTLVAPSCGGPIHASYNNFGEVKAFLNHLPELPLTENDPGPSLRAPKIGWGSVLLLSVVLFFFRHRIRAGIALWRRRQGLDESSGERV